MRARSEEALDVRWHFGNFTLRETQRRLERDGQAVRLGPRSFDLLLLLLQRAGQFVSKDELLSTVWAGVVVEDGSVRVHMSTLRKALGRPDDGDGCAEWITTVPLRGYRFNGRVRREVPHASPGALPRSAPPSFARLPVRLSGLVGREADVEDVLASLESQRLVTIAGTGGIGKTSVAIHAAERYQLTHGAQVAFADLAPLISQDHVLGTIARAVGAPADLPDALGAMTQCLADGDVLLLIDNCEHVVDSLAPPVAGLLSALPRLRILATSREPLRVPGEYVLRLSTLAIPDAECLSLAEAMRWPAVELLIERARAAGAGAFVDSHGPLLAAISRQVDGIPLAIELVAARLGVQSIEDLARRLGSHLRLYALDNRAALPRHRTLAAALDWSVALLDDAELRIFRRLSVFRGRFDVASALGVTARDMNQEAAFDALVSLVNKSLVFFDGSDTVAPYRLLDTTRSYAAELLAGSDERPSLLQQHAAFMLDLMKAAAEDLQELTEHAWSDRYAYRLDDVRFALDTCLVQQPDAGAAASLAIASAPLWFRLSEVSEYLGCIRAALDHVHRSPVPDRLAAGRLEIALYNALWHTGGALAEMTQACERALAGALEFKVPALEFQARWGLCALNVTRGEYASALRHAEILNDHAGRSHKPVTRNLSQRMLALASHLCGAFPDAEAHAREAAGVDEATRRHRDNAFQPDARTTAVAILARTLWIRGDGDLAMRTALQCREEAEALGHALSLCVALFWICPVAIWAGERTAARGCIDRMLQVTESKGFAYWHQWALCYDDALKLDEVVDRAAHVEEVRAKLPALDDPRREMLVTFCDEWLDDSLVVRAMHGEAQWSTAEVFRAVGRRQERRDDTAGAEALYLRALALARSQGAGAGEWRAARALDDLACAVPR